MTEYNLYCDESCHLEHDDSDVMVLGALIIPKDKRQEITENILQIKARYGVKARTEVKWTKASMPKIDLYKDLLNCFFLDDDMRFRVLVAKKTRLNHEAWSQSHNDWYYKMYFTMLDRLFDSANTYNVYVDIKDTHSAQRTEKLEEVLANSQEGAANPFGRSADDADHRCNQRSRLQGEPDDHSPTIRRES